MTEREIYDGVIINGTTDFAFVVETLRRHRAGWCVIDGLAVNSYVTPVYTADCDLVVAVNELAPVLADLRAADFRVEDFPFSINAQRRAGPTQRRDCLLMVQFSKATELQPFVSRAVLRPIFGFDVPVAALPDLVAAKLAAWTEPRRRPSKRTKDELDLLRLASVYAEIVDPLLPSSLLEKARADRAHAEKFPEGDGWGTEDWEAVP